MSEPAPRVGVEVSDGIAEVRLSRPDKLNALDPAMFDALIAAGERLKSEPGLRAVVLHGEGRAFCAGLDMASFAAMGPDAGEALLGGARTGAGANRVQQAAMVWREVPVPVVAVLQGAVFGGGLQVALGADLRFAAADARLAVAEVRWGLVPDMGGFALLRGLVRDDHARELTFSGREVGAEEAFALGLVTRVCADPLAQARAFAREVAGRSPDAVRAAKRLFERVRDLDAAAILRAETQAQAALLGAPNQLEAVAAGLQRRSPRFRDPG